MKPMHTAACFFSLLILINLSCANNAATGQNSPYYIEGAAAHDMDINIFNGIAVRKIKLSEGRFRYTHSTTDGLYGAAFFTKNNYYPLTVVFKVADESVSVRTVSLAQLKDEKNGILTGVVYKPVLGGRMKEQTGISVMYGNEKIEIKNGDVLYPVNTAEDGAFAIELPQGEYSVIFNSKELGKVIIEPGKTVIKNIQKGMVLMD